MAAPLDGITTDVPLDPDAQATVTDFLDYTEYLPSDLVRSLTLIGKLDESYLSFADEVHQLSAAYAALPSASPTNRPSSQDLRRQISGNLDYAINARESSYAEASRLYDVVDRHSNRLKSIISKLHSLPKPPSRDPTPVPQLRSPQLNRAKTASKEGQNGTPPPRIMLRLEGPRAAGSAGRTTGSTARPRYRSQKITVPGEVLPPPNPDSPPPVTDSEWEFQPPSPVPMATSRVGAASRSRLNKPARVRLSKTPKAPRIKAPKVSRPPRPPGAMGTNVHSAVAGISTSNALSLLDPPPADAKPGSEHAPWMRLTEWEMAKLRKRMKKNAIWSPSETMIRRELSDAGRGPENYRSSKARALATGEEFIDDDKIATTAPGKPLAPGEISADSLGLEETQLSNRGMKLNEAKKLKREVMAREQAAIAAAEAEQAAKRLGDVGSSFKSLFTHAVDENGHPSTGLPSEPSVKHVEKEKDKEKVKGKEKEREQEKGREQAKLRELAKARELAKERQLAKERELANALELEKEQELAKERELAQEREVAKEKEAREKELARKSELIKEREQEKEKEQLMKMAQEKESERAEEKQDDIEMEMDLDPKNRDEDEKDRKEKENEKERENERVEREEREQQQRDEREKQGEKETENENEKEKEITRTSVKKRKRAVTPKKEFAAPILDAIASPAKPTSKRRRMTQPHPPPPLSISSSTKTTTVPLAPAAPSPPVPSTPTPQIRSPTEIYKASAPSTRSRRLSLTLKGPAPPPEPLPSRSRPSSRAASRRGSTVGPPSASIIRDLRRRSATPAAASTPIITAAGRRSKRPAPGPVTNSQEGGAAVSEGRRKNAPRKRGSAAAAHARKQAEEAGHAREKEEEAAGEDIDPDEPRYCFCGDVSFGTMILCENTECEREWFHLECVGLQEPPGRRTKWYCEECKTKHGKK